MLTLFNVAAESVVNHWMSITVEDKSATHEGLGMAVGCFMGVFNADGGMIGLRDLEWLKGTINVLIRLFIRIRIMANVEKYNTMTCQTRAICTRVLEEDFS